jgi:hypothetical protein
MHCNDSARSSRQRSANLCPSPMRCPRRLIGCYASAPVAGASASAAPAASEHTSNGNPLAVPGRLYSPLFQEASAHWLEREERE